MEQKQLQFPDIRFSKELDETIRQERDLAAEMFVKDLNGRFFETISKGLMVGQQITFTDSDGSRYIITPNQVANLTEDDVDFVVNDKGRQTCPNCKRSVAKMKVWFDKDHLSCAIKAFEYAVKNDQQYIQINDIGLTKQEYSKMNRLVKFGLAFRKDEIKINGSNIGVYGIPRKRISDFIRGQWKVANSFLQDPTLPEGHEGKRKMSETRITIDQVQSVSALREILGEHLTTYEWKEQDCFE